MSELRAVIGRVRGRVQGVFYRASFRREALSRGLSGWIRNLPDGSVEFQLQGEIGSVETLLDWARAGPENARVDDVDLREVPVDTALAAFEVRP